MTEHIGWARPEFELFAAKHDLVLINTLEMYTPWGISSPWADRYVAGYNGDINTIRTIRREVDRVGGVMILGPSLPSPVGDQGQLYPEHPVRAVGGSPLHAGSGRTHPIFDLLDEIEVVNGGNLETKTASAPGRARILGFKAPGAATPIPSTVWARA